MKVSQLLHSMDKCSKTNGKTRYYGETIASDNVEERCEWFISTADVVPKSEVVKALNEVELLIIITKETYKQQMEDAPNELSKQSKRTKWIAFEKFYEQFAELKKKYTGDNKE